MPRRYLGLFKLIKIKKKYMSDKYFVSKKFNVVFSNEELETPVGRAAWPSLVTAKAPQEGQDGEPKFELTMLIPKDGPKTEAFLAKLQAQIDEMIPLYNKASPAKLASLPLLKDGDAADPEKYPQHKGNWVLVARNAKEVRVVDGSADPKDLDKSTITGGMKVKALVAAKVHSKGVGFTLKIVQLVKDDGVRFGGGVRDLTKMLSACEDDEADTGSLAEVHADPTEAASAVNEPKLAGAIGAGGKRAQVSAKMTAAINKL